MRAPRNEERLLWREAMRNVKPLRRVHAHPVIPEPIIESSAIVETKAPASRPRPAPAHHAPGTGLDRRSTQKLKRGQMTVHGRLDLHGHTQDRAHAALNKFIANADAAGKRLLIVITGKSGVLHRAVPLWLADGENRARILSIAPAQAKHGGDGALYVLLRRQR